MCFKSIPFGINSFSGFNTTTPQSKTLIINKYKYVKKNSRYS